MTLGDPQWYNKLERGSGMRDHICKCLECEEEKCFRFGRPYPVYGQHFYRYCAKCGKDTPHTMVLTKKIAADLRRQEEERQLQESIVRKCESYGFFCRFLYRLVIITTPVSSWQFDYHESRKTLLHESTVKINFQTGDPAKVHVQFSKKMSINEAIDYIAAHDNWKQDHK